MVDVLSIITLSFRLLLYNFDYYSIISIIPRLFRSLLGYFDYYSISLWLNWAKNRNVQKIEKIPHCGQRKCVLVSSQPNTQFNYQIQIPLPLTAVVWHFEAMMAWYEWYRSGLGSLTSLYALAYDLHSKRFATQWKRLN